MSRSLIVSGAGSLVPEDRPYWTSPDMYNANWLRNVFSTKEVAEVFFGRSRTWLYHLMPITDDEVGPIEPIILESGHRHWRLWDIERQAHVLLRAHKISVSRFGLVINVIKSVATMYGYDVGDPQYRALWDAGEDSVRTQALGLVQDQLAADQNTPTKDRTEQLADVAAWAIRKLEEHLKGLDQ